MVLATGSDLIDDIKRAPDDVLSKFERVDEVCSVSVLHRAPIFIKNYLACSAKIHAKRIEGPQHAYIERNSIQIDAGYCRYFRGDP